MPFHCVTSCCWSTLPSNAGLQYTAATTINTSTAIKCGSNAFQLKFFINFLFSETQINVILLANIIMKLNIFLSRIAFLCNVLFLYCVFHSIKDSKWVNDTVESYVATLGLVAPLLNFVVNIFTLFLLFQQKLNGRNVWIYTCNFLILVYQIWHFFH